MSMTDHQNRIHETMCRLEEVHAEIALCLNELHVLAVEESLGGDLCLSGGGHNPNHHPVADHATFSVIWIGRRCFLGRTLAFKLFERLARRPNQYVTYDRLLQDVWNGLRSNEAIRSVVKELRRKLIDAGMSDLADAIDGSNRECYGLILDRGR